MSLAPDPFFKLQFAYEVAALFYDFAGSGFFGLSFFRGLLQQ